MESLVLIRQLHNDDACDFSRHGRLTRGSADVAVHDLEHVIGGHVSKRVQDVFEVVDSAVH